MAFNHRFPDAVPVLDTAGLVALISDPKKSAELWAKYEAVRKEYEALRASVKAEVADLDKYQAEMLVSHQDLITAKAGFAKEVADFDAAKSAWVKQRNAVEDAVAKRDAELTDRAAVLEAKKAQLGKRAADLDEQERKAQVAQMDWSYELTGKANVLADREAAVAAREEKAEKLAQLLKGV